MKDLEHSGFSINDYVCHWFAGCGVILSFNGKGIARCRWDNGGSGLAYIKDLKQEI